MAKERRKMGIDDEEGWQCRWRGNRRRRRRRRKKMEEHTTTKSKKIQKFERYNDRRGCRPKINLLLGGFHTYRVDQRIKEL